MPNRIQERDFVARHAFQKIDTAQAQSDPTLQQAGVPGADVDNDGAIEGDPELRSLYQKLLSLDSSATASTGVDLDAPSVRPVYNALTMRFTQKTGTEAALGNRKLVDVPELAAVKHGAGVLARRDGVKQLGVGSIQDALIIAASAEEARTGRPSLLRVSLGASNANRGFFGPGTEAAVKELQRQSGFPADGKIDVNTLNALDALVTAARTPAPTPTPPPAPPPSTGPITHQRFASHAQLSEVLAGRAILRAGEQGPHVSALQQALMDMGFPMLTLVNDVGVSGVDGSWGGQTDVALRNFQTHAKKKHPDVRVNGVLDAATMRAMIALAPEPGKKAWDAGQPSHAPPSRWNGDPTKPLRIVTVKDEHRTFLYNAQGQCTGIFPNAHGTAGSETETGLKKIVSKLDEAASRATGESLWQTPRAFGKRILNLSWASGARSGEELHGTYDYRNMGKNVSHGCVRHYNEHIVEMYNAVSVNELVAIVDSVDDPMLRA